MSHYDQLHRFLFEHHDIRSEIVSLDKVYRTVTDQRQYPERIQCSCSRERTGRTLIGLEGCEMRDIFAESGAVEVESQYCGEQYRFDAADIDELFNPDVPTVH